MNSEDFGFVCLFVETLCCHFLSFLNRVCKLWRVWIYMFVEVCLVYSYIQVWGLLPWGVPQTP